MNSNKLWMTAQNPSCFGMPMSGHAFGTTTVVRERVAAIALRHGCRQAGPGLTQSYFPGNSAWRPPSC